MFDRKFTKIILLIFLSSIYLFTINIRAAQKTARTKIICVSDMHMSDARSSATDKGYKPYGWFKGENTKGFAYFLKNKVLEDNTVKELIILGDFFDNWICPANMDPNNGGSEEDFFKSVAAAPQNKTSIDLIKQIIAAGIKVIYVPGNHDMQLSKDILTKIIPGIIYDGKDGMGKYQEGDIVGEHGHRYDIINTPYSVYKDSHMLPVGFYLSRVDASKKAYSLSDKTLKDVVDMVLNKTNSANGDWEPFENIPALIYGIYSIVIVKVDNIYMNGLDNYKGILSNDAIYQHFLQIGRYWKNIKQCNWDEPLLYSVLVANYSDLKEAALYEYIEPNLAKVVLMGHTHSALLVGWNKVNGRLDKVDIPDFDGQNYIITDYLYANSGTWKTYGTGAEPGKKMGTYIIVKPVNYTEAGKKIEKEVTLNKIVYEGKDKNNKSKFDSVILKMAKVSAPTTNI